MCALSHFPSSVLSLRALRSIGGASKKFKQRILESIVRPFVRPPSPVIPPSTNRPSNSHSREPNTRFPRYPRTRVHRPPARLTHSRVTWSPSFRTDHVRPVFFFFFLSGTTRAVKYGPALPPPNARAPRRQRRSHSRTRVYPVVTELEYAVRHRKTTRPFILRALVAPSARHSVPATSVRPVFLFFSTGTTFPPCHHRTRVHLTRVSLVANVTVPLVDPEHVYAVRQRQTTRPFILRAFVPPSACRSVPATSVRHVFFFFYRVPSYATEHGSVNRVLHQAVTRGSESHQFVVGCGQLPSRTVPPTTRPGLGNVMNP